VGLSGVALADDRIIPRFHLEGVEASIGIIGTTRSGLLVAHHPEDPNLRVLCQTKSNLAPLAPALLFEPVSEGGTVRIEWRGECDYGADDLLRPSQAQPDQLARARHFLLEALAAGPVEQKQLRAIADEAAIAWRTVERAKEVLGVLSRREGWGPGSRCWWELTTHAEGDA
jgi:hypothetical protein